MKQNSCWKKKDGVCPGACLFQGRWPSIDLHFFSCRYPTTSEYLQVVKMLIAKYPFLKDLEGNGYVSALANN